MSSSIALKTDGTLWAWGLNSSGQLGFGNQTNYSSPKQVGSLTTWLKIAGTYTSTYAITTSGALYAWGSNNVGQLGLGNITAYSSPKQVGSLTTWTTLSTFGGNANNILAIGVNTV
jgi:alpha-tubulin suppressor-like RCC1 family protein